MGCWSQQVLAVLLVAALMALGADARVRRSGAFIKDNEDAWDCTSISKTMLTPGVVWQQLNCSSKWIVYEPIGPLIFNLVSTDLTSTTVQPTPMMANQSVEYGVQDVPDMGSQRSTLFVGINGGYFWELNNPTFIDNVCLGKSRAEASTPVSPTNPQYGIGDTLLIIDGEVLGRNCKSITYDVPIALILNGTGSTIVRMEEAGVLPASVQNAIAAGPNLVSFDASTNSSFIDVPLDDFDPNVWEHAANTAVGLSLGAQGAETLWLVTVDGHDGGSIFQPTSGINAHELAHFMKYYLNVQMAMGMDQGGSTTMWIKGQPNDGVVSNAFTPDSTHAPRAVFDGLFLEMIQ